MKKYITWLVVPVLLFVLVVPTGAQAATVSATNQQQIAYLYAMVAQLQAQLNALLALNGGASATNNVSVQTDGVSVVDSDYIEMNGRVTFKQDGDARVWFEYGLTNALSYSTESENISNKDRNDSVSFSLIAPDLSRNTMYYYRAVAEGVDGRFAEGVIKSFKFEGASRSGSANTNDDTPTVTSDNADDVQDDSAILVGDIDMNDFENGYVFFVYGEDKNAIKDAADESEYRDIDTDGNDIKKVVVNSSFDGDDSFEKTVTGLNDDTDYYFSLCVQYDDEDDDVTLECSTVENFTTDN